jgi:hypothetical protein
MIVSAVAYCRMEERGVSALPLERAGKNVLIARRTQVISLLITKRNVKINNEYTKEAKCNVTNEKVKTISDRYPSSQYFLRRVAQWGPESIE